MNREVSFKSSKMQIPENNDNKDIEKYISGLEENIQTLLNKISELQDEAELNNMAIDELRMKLEDAENNRAYGQYNENSLTNREELEGTDNTSSDTRKVHWPNTAQVENSMLSKPRLGDLAPPQGRHKLLIFSDSQGRGLVHEVDELLSTDFNILSNVQSGGTLQVVMNTLLQCSEVKNFSKDDYVLLLAGTNNIDESVFKNSDYKLVSELLTYLDEKIKFTSHTNLILANIPYRYDLRNNDRRNLVIAEVNAGIKNLSKKYDHVLLLDLYLLPWWLHTRHGLHINRRGKKGMAKQILGLVKYFSSSLSQNGTDPDSEKKPFQVTTAVQDDFDEKSSSEKISSSGLQGQYAGDAEAVWMSKADSQDLATPAHKLTTPAMQMDSMQSLNNTTENSFLSIS